ncbi:MAG TPA: hypothetical protein VFW25_01175 [Silvibacterium sp.]|nr:hypothetical protein [Silvibacterium sp.]
MGYIREILADSHIAAVAIAVLLLESVISGCIALWGPLCRAAIFLFTAVAIRDVPYVSRTLTLSDRLMLTNTSLYFFDGLISLAAAWFLSRWIFGAGPVQSLGHYRNALARRSNAG